MKIFITSENGERVDATWDKVEMGHTYISKYGLYTFPTTIETALMGQSFFTWGFKLFTGEARAIKNMHSGFVDAKSFTIIEEIPQENWNKLSPNYKFGKDWVKFTDGDYWRKITYDDEDEILYEDSTGYRRGQTYVSGDLKSINSTYSGLWEASK